MRNLNFIIGILASIIVFFNMGHSQETTWEQVDPGGNGWLMFASIHPATGHLYFSSDMNLSLFRSTDQAETWQPIANPIPGTAFYIAGDPKDPNILYMNQQGTSAKSSGIWRSKDNGDTWEHIYRTEEFGIDRGQSGIVDPEDNRILYWTTPEMGVKRSADGGYSWQDISTGLPIEQIKHGRHLNELDLDYDSPPKHRRIFYPTNVGLYFLEEPQYRWNLISGGLPKDNCTDVQVCNNGIFYAAFPDHGLFRSKDKGESWQRLENGLYGKTCFRVIATKNRPDILYIATSRDQGVYGSQDGGQSFRLLTHRRFNSQYNWPINYRQHEAVSGQIMFIDPNDPYTVYMDYNKKTHDGGQSWQHYGTEEVRQDRWRGTGLSLLTDYRVVFDPKRPNLVWFGFSDTGLMLSEDHGESIINVISFHRGEVNQAAYWRDKLVRSSGSCVSMAVDPELSTTIYASINGKNANSRAAVGGIIIKSVDGGWNWTPIYEKHGLDDGIVRSIIIDPSSPATNRTIYVASYANGIYKSIDDGKSFKCITSDKLFAGNTRIMWLEMAPSQTEILYMGVGGSYGIRPITFGPTHYPALKPGMFGGVFKTTNGGKSWKKCNSSREIPSVQDIAVHPFNPDIVYVAAYNENYLIQDSDPQEWAQGGVYRSVDGGRTWTLTLRAPSDEYMGQGEVEGICINPVAPEILYAAVRRYGIYRSMDEGKTWEQVGQTYMDRMQKRYHSIDLNPHDPSEVWVAHFGNSFSKGIDSKARDYMWEKFKKVNFVVNPGFEELESSTQLPLNWKMEQPAAPLGESAVISISNNPIKSGDCSLRFNLTQAYCNAPSRIPAIREQLRLEKKGKISIDEGRVPREGTTGETNSWIYQDINPYFTTIMRGHRVKIEMDVFIEKRELPTRWSRGSEMGEIPRDPPQVYLTEVRDYNVHWMVAETSLQDLESIEKIKDSDMKGKWYHCQALGHVSNKPHWLRVTVTGVGLSSGPMDVYVDNVRLGLLE